MPSVGLLPFCMQVRPRTAWRVGAATGLRCQVSMRAVVCSLAHAQLLTTSITSHRLLTSLLGANAGQQFVCAPLNSPVLFCHLPLQLCGPLGRGLRDGPRA